MIPMAIPLADIIYRSYYDEQEYHLRMQQLAGFANRLAIAEDDGFIEFVFWEQIGSAQPVPVAATF